MQNLLLLPGNSPHHREWVEDLKNALASSAGKIITQHYRHWETGEPLADVTHEISVASEKASNLTPYSIIGKSIGTIIALSGIASGHLTPEKVILLGIPIQGTISPQEVSDWLGQLTIPVTIIQNTNDPYGSFQDIKDAFSELNTNISFIELPGETHDYLDFEAIKTTSN